MTPGTPIGLLLALTYAITLTVETIPVIIDSAGNSAIINESSDALIIDDYTQEAVIIDDRVTIE